MTKHVAKRSDLVDAMIAAAFKARALMRGSEGMREAGETFLPRFSAESREDYAARLRVSWLFNGYRKTVRDMAGRVFSKPVEIADDAPPQVVEWAKNVDLQGNDLSVFARRLFEDGLNAGVSYVMVDAPPRRGQVTQAQVQSGNLRPYFVHLRVEDIIGWKTEVVNNVTVISQIRIAETVAEPDPKDEFAEVMVPQVRVLDRTPGGVQTRVFRKVDGGTEEWREEQPPTFSAMSEITVVPFYANRTGFLTGAPILDDLADVNIAHWQSQSDQRHMLHFIRVPILFAKGRRDDEGPLVIAPGVATTSESSEASLEWVEHSGAAVGAGRIDLKDLEFQMEAHGLQLLVAKPAQSATGEALDAAKETSILGMTADQLRDALERALSLMAAYGGLDGSNISVTVNTDFGISAMGAQELTALLTAVNTGNLSRETFLAEMRRRGMVASDLDIDDEVERIEGEGGGVSQMPAPVMPPRMQPTEDAPDDGR